MHYVNLIKVQVLIWYSFPYKTCYGRSKSNYPASAREAWLIDDVLIKVDKLLFSIDFIVIETEEDWNMSVILGDHSSDKPSINCVEKCVLILRVEDEQTVFSMYTTFELTSNLEECFRIHVD